MTTRMKGLLALLGGLSIIAVISAPRSSQPPSSAPSASANSSPTLASRVGSDCSIDSMTPGALSAAQAYELAQLVKKQDRENLAALLASGRMQVLTESSRARVIDADWTNAALKIRVLTGMGIGRELWVHHVFCRG